MAFWSGQKLFDNLKDIIENPSEKPIANAAYELRIGPEQYVTPDAFSSNPHGKTKVKLNEKDSFSIPPGQFAFLLTEELISIPHYAIGFISMKAGIKFKGLVNVSGFHVDPGYKGRLGFSVFNAGPVPIDLDRGDEAFALWIADLSETQSDKYKRKNPGYESIPTSMINAIPGELHSLQGLSKKISDADQKIEKLKIHAGIYAVIIVLIVGFLLRGPIYEEIKGLLSYNQEKSVEEKTK